MLCVADVAALIPLFVVARVRDCNTAAGSLLRCLLVRLSAACLTVCVVFRCGGVGAHQAIVGGVIVDDVILATVVAYGQVLFVGVKRKCKRLFGMVCLKSQ